MYRIAIIDVTNGPRQDKEIKYSSVPDMTALDNVLTNGVILNSSCTPAFL
jgi:hypothetical protein